MDDLTGRKDFGKERRIKLWKKIRDEELECWKRQSPIGGDFSF